MARNLPCLQYMFSWISRRARHVTRERPLRYSVATVLLISGIAFGASQHPDSKLEPDGAPDRQTDGPGVPPPIVWAAPSLGTGPFPLESAEERNLRVVVVTRGFEQPWSMAFLPGGDMLVTERPGRLRLVHD